MLIDDFGGLFRDIGGLGQKFWDFYKMGACIGKGAADACLMVEATV